MANAPAIALYVSSVPGRLVSRPGSPHSYIGARTRSPDEIKAGKADPVWDVEAVIAITQADYDRFVREWNALINDGDLQKRSEDEFKAYAKKLAEAEKKHAEALEAAAKKKADEAAKTATESGSGGATPPGGKA